MFGKHRSLDKMSLGKNILMFHLFMVRYKSPLFLVCDVVEVMTRGCNEWPSHFTALMSYGLLKLRSWACFIAVALSSELTRINISTELKHCSPHDALLHEGANTCEHKETNNNTIRIAINISRKPIGYHTGLVKKDTFLL